MKKKKICAELIIVGFILELMNFAYVPFVNHIEQKLEKSDSYLGIRYLLLGAIIALGIVISHLIKGYVKVELQKKTIICERNRWLELVKSKKAESLLEYGESKYILGFDKVVKSFEVLNAKINIGISISMIVLFSSYICIFIHIKYTVLIILLIVFMFVFGGLSSPLEKKKYKVNEQEKKNLKYINNIISSSQIIKNYFMEKPLEAIFEENLNASFKYHMKERDYTNILYVYMQSIRCAIMVAIPSVTAVFVKNGMVEEGVIIVSMYSFFYVLGHVMSIMENVEKKKRYEGDMKIVNEGWNIETSKETNEIVDIKGRSISYRDLSAGYEKRVLDNITLDLSGNGVTIIQGESGSGKSTLLKCLMGLKKPESGRVEIEGMKYDIENIAQSIAYVPQYPILVRGTPFENIRMGNEYISDEKIDNLLDYFGDEAKKIIKNKDSVNCLSGGQKQLVCILRALISDADFIIFDEPTSSLNEEIKEKFISLIFEIGKTKKILIATHDNKLLEIETKKVVLS